MMFSRHIKPVVLLTKLDLYDDSESYLKKVRYFYPDIHIELVSSIERIGIEAVYHRMLNRETAVFVDASGVGKSTLINQLIRSNQAKTSDIRQKDDKGRHTTTHRELFELRNDSYVIDTPGIREIGLWMNDETLSEYQDIYLIARACKYRNCKHENEADCAVKRAVELGELSKKRYKSFIKMTREICHTRLKQDEAEKLRFKSSVKRQCKNERYTRR